MPVQSRIVLGYVVGRLVQSANGIASVIVDGDIASIIIIGMAICAIYLFGEIMRYIDIFVYVSTVRIIAMAYTSRISMSASANANISCRVTFAAKSLRSGFIFI